MKTVLKTIAAAVLFSFGVIAYIGANQEFHDPGETNMLFVVWLLINGFICVITGVWTLLKK